MPPDTPPPPPQTDRSPDDWTPYEDRIEFETADFLYTRNQMSGGDINFLMDLWAASAAVHNDRPPYKNYDALYSKIDSTPLGDVKWESVNVGYTGSVPQKDAPTWMKTKYDVWYRDPRALVQNLISNPDFNGEFDYSPLQEHDENGNHRFQNFMSGNWAWQQAVSLVFLYICCHPRSIRLKDEIAKESGETHGSMFVPIILGSDKTTVSVATGQNEYWPVYLSIGNMHNNVRRAHRNSVVLLGFLPIPKSTLSTHCVSLTTNC